MKESWLIVLAPESSFPDDGDFDRLPAFAAERVSKALELCPISPHGALPPEGVRYLHFGSDWVQGAMRVARPWSLELDYTREMMAGLLLRQAAQWPRRVLLIGLGAGSLTKFLYRHRPQAQLTVVEIAPRVVAAARHHFRLPAEDERLQIVIGDGADYVMKKGTAFDLILVDGFDEDAKVGSLDSLPFYLNAKARLSPQGLLVTNLLSRRKDFRAGIARLKEAFDDRALVFPCCDSGNAAAFATNGAAISLSLEELAQRAALLRKETALNLAPTLSRLAQMDKGGRLEI